MSDPMLHIDIDVSLAEDQIRGQVGDGVRQPRPFSGWLGLIGQLDELLGSPREPGKDARAPGSPPRPAAPSAGGGGRGSA